jgi:hypothetical protein
MKLNSKVFRAKAANARKLAATYQDPPYCGDMLALAEQWDALASAVDSYAQKQAQLKKAAVARKVRRGRPGL